MSGLPQVLSKAVRMSRQRDKLSVFIEKISSGVLI